MNVQTYCHKWNLTDVAKLTQTLTSHLFLVKQSGRPAVLKLFTDLGLKHEVKSATVLECFAGRGAVRLLYHDQGAHLLEYVDGPDLKSFALSKGDEAATLALVDVLKKLHSYSGPIPSGLISMRENFRSLLNRKFPDSSLYSVGASVAEHLLQTAQDVRVLHGDIHHQNVLLSHDREWLAIDPQCVVGERTYDLANVFYNPDDCPDWVETKGRIINLCRIFSENLGIAPRRILEYAFAYGCLSASWAEEDGLDPQRRLRIASKIQDVLNSVQA